MPAADPVFSLVPVAEADFEELATLRTSAMRESLEKVGRFDPARSRARLRDSFSPTDTFAIVVKGQRIGFIATRRDDAGLQLDHLYLAPAFQRLGVGGAVLDTVCRQADAAGLTIFVTALKQSPSNTFYQRHGFTRVAESEWDNHYARFPKTARVGAALSIP